MGRDIEAQGDLSGVWSSSVEGTASTTDEVAVSRLFYMHVKRGL